MYLNFPTLPCVHVHSDASSHGVLGADLTILRRPHRCPACLVGGDRATPGWAALRREGAGSPALPVHVGWGGQDFRESFSESCGGVAKGRKSTKVAGGARASGYCIVRTMRVTVREVDVSVSQEPHGLPVGGPRDKK